MAPDLARMMSKDTMMQILEHARAVTTSILSRLLSNKMSAWNVAMREEMESVSANLRRPKPGSGYTGWLGFTVEYTNKVVNIYEDKRNYYKDKLMEMNE